MYEFTTTSLLESRSCLFWGIIAKQVFSYLFFKCWWVALSITQYALYEATHMKSLYLEVLKTMKVSFGDYAFHCSSFCLKFKEVKSMWGSMAGVILHLRLA